MMRALAVAALTWWLATPAFAQTLVIAGGGVSQDNASIYRAFIAALPDPARDTIALVPSASAEPALSAASARDAFVRYGVEPSRIVVLPLALFDDPATADVNEADWASNGDSAELASQISSVGGVWFTGGDQLRTARLLTEASPVLSSMRSVLARGGVIGGSSAGAAIMSETMIGRGDPVASLTLPALSAKAEGADLESGALALRRGLGFFPFGIVDQHFDRDMRLGRLARALVLSETRWGFGADEDTAMVVHLADATMRVAGRGAVAVLDARDAVAETEAGIRGVRIALLPAGSAFSFRTAAAELGALAPREGGSLSARFAAGGDVFAFDDRDEHGSVTYRFKRGEAGWTQLSIVSGAAH